jgi:hypothetical protein
MTVQTKLLSTRIGQAPAVLAADLDAWFLATGPMAIPALSVNYREWDRGKVMDLLVTYVAPGILQYRAQSFTTVSAVLMDAAINAFLAVSEYRRPRFLFDLTTDLVRQTSTQQTMLVYTDSILPDVLDIRGSRVIIGRAQANVAAGAVGTFDVIKGGGPPSIDPGTPALTATNRGVAVCKLGRDAYLVADPMVPGTLLAYPTCCGGI